MKVGLPQAWQDSIAGWCRVLKVAGRSERTIRTRRGHVEAVARLTHTRSPADVTLNDLIALFSEHDYSREHRRGARTSLNQFYGWCVDHGVAQHNPAAGLPRVSEGTPKPRPAPEWLWSELVRDAPPRELLMIRLAGEAGLRRGEISRLHTDDVMWDGEGYSLRVDGKGDKQRVVPINERLGEQLSRMPRGFVFPSLDRWGNVVAAHLSADRVGRLVSELMGPGWSAHTLRHRYATKGYVATRNLRAVQVALGHASVATTQRYTAVSEPDVRAVANAVAS